jgi:hypothetical protein
MSSDGEPVLGAGLKCSESQQAGEVNRRLIGGHPSTLALAGSGAAKCAGTNDDRGIFSRTENFFAKSPFRERLPPFWHEPFLDRFLGEEA